jgi:hypothetical protein
MTEKIKLYKFNHVETIAARSIGEARAFVVETYGQESIEFEHEVTEEEMDNLTLVECDENDNPDKRTKKTYREFLKKMILEDKSEFPTEFCSMEY